MNTRLTALKSDFMLRANGNDKSDPVVMVEGPHYLTDTLGNYLTDTQSNRLIGYSQSTVSPIALHALKSDFKLRAN